MGLGEKAFVMGGHAVVLATAVLVIAAYLLWQSETFKIRHRLPLWSLLWSIVLIHVLLMVEALFYGNARLLILGVWGEAYSGINLWKETAAIVALRLLVAACIFVHLPPFWRVRPGMTPTKYALRIAGTFALLALIFIGVTAWLY